MGNILFEKEVCAYLNIPSIPLKKFEEGGKSFKSGVAVVSLLGRLAYAVATYDSETDSEPRIVKTFSLEPFSTTSEIFVVPEYMDGVSDVENMDLDEASKAAAMRIANEAEAMENEGVKQALVELPENEYFFPQITNDEEGRAFIQSYNNTNKIRGNKIPKTHDGIIARLGVIWHEEQQRKLQVAQ